MFVFCGILAPTYPLRRHEYVSSLYLHTPRLIWPPKNIQTIYSILRPRENQNFLHLRSEALSMIKLCKFWHAVRSGYSLKRAVFTPTEAISAKTPRLTSQLVRGDKRIAIDTLPLEISPACSQFFFPWRVCTVIEALSQPMESPEHVDITYWV